MWNMMHTLSRLSHNGVLQSVGQKSVSSATSRRFRVRRLYERRRRLELRGSWTKDGVRLGMAWR
jgi:hypothetical protein